MKEKERKKATNDIELFKKAHHEKKSLHEKQIEEVSKQVEANKAREEKDIFKLEELNTVVAEVVKVEPKSIFMAE